MRVLYSVINFLILAAILVLAGRKMVLKMLRSRREKIEQDLLLAQQGQQALEQATAQAQTLEREFAGQLEQVEADGQKRLEEKTRELRSRQEQAEALAEQQLQRDLEIYRLTMISETEKSIVREIVEQAEQSLRLPEDFDALCAAKIAGSIRKSAGDQVTLSGKKLAVRLEYARQPGADLVGDMLAAVGERYAVEPGDLAVTAVARADLIGGIRLTVNDTVYDTTVRNTLRGVEKNLHPRISDTTDKAQVCQAVESAMKELDLSIDIYQEGRVLSVSDGICRISGLSDAMYGEMVEFDTGVRGMVMDLEREYIGCVIFGSFEHVEEGDLVRRSGYVMEVPVGEAMLGRVVDALGKPIDGKGVITASEHRPIECPAPSIPDRQSVSVPLQTGIKAIDALVPIGRGQRELLIGDRQTGKSAIVLDTIINQKGKDVICIYVAIGQKESTVAGIMDTLTRHGAMEYTTIVCADAYHSAPMQYVAPYAGTAMGEYFMYKGKDVLIVFDDLSKHAVAYREISLLLHRPSGREAYPGDVFYLHSRLLERSARLCEKAGGGSMTALPIIETQAGDISAYIPTNVISITDGQIFLESELFHAGQRPAVNVGLSVSRVGGAAQIGAMRQVAGRLRMDLAQYRELAAFSQFGSDLDASTKKAIAKGERMMALLNQPQYAPVAVERQVLAIFAVSEGFADDVEPEAIAEFEAGLCSYVAAAHPEMLRQIAGGEKMSPAFMDELRACIGAYKETLT